MGGEDLGRGKKDLGRKTPFNGERGLSPKPTLYQSRSHRAPSRIGTIFRGKDLGKGQTSWKKFTPSQTYPPQELSHHAPSYDGMGFERDGKTLEERPLSTEKGVSLLNPLSTKAVPTALHPELEQILEEKTLGRGKLLGRSSPLPKPIPLKNFPTTLRP